MIDGCVAIPLDFLIIGKLGVTGLMDGWMISWMDG